MVGEGHGKSNMNQTTPYVPPVSVKYARDDCSTRANILGIRPTQERAYQNRGEQYLLIKAQPASAAPRFKTA
jgi:hypothetical protein